MTDIPIACLLDAAELAARREGLLPGLAARALEREVLNDGLRWRFAPSRGLLELIASVVDAERQCCRFLRFDLTVEAGGGPVWLAVTGPSGTRELLEAVTGK
jgi:hypothetical protein